MACMWGGLVKTKEKYTGFSLWGSLWEEGFVGKGPGLLGLILSQFLPLFLGQDLTKPEAH